MFLLTARTKYVLFLLVLLLLLVRGAATLSEAAAMPIPGRPYLYQPNVILIMADDLDMEAIAYMPHLQRLLVRQGLSFDSFFVPTPICCPARASLLRGQYAHNTGVLVNSGTHGGYTTFMQHHLDASTFATWLDTAGYYTIFLGKYLNGYGGTAVPAGWDSWYGLTGATSYYQYELNTNGQLVSYGKSPEDYQTDVLANLALNELRQGIPAKSPFFMWFSPYAPHTATRDGPAPAPRHKDLFPDVQAPRPPSFNEADLSDKPDWLQSKPLLGKADIKKIDTYYRTRLQSLQAIDEFLVRLVKLLRKRDMLADTYIIFTSDNGFQQGEHRILLTKNRPYEESIRVPLIVRGPGVPPGRTTHMLAEFIDLAPTLADLAETKTPAFVDGRSLVPILDWGGSAEAWRQAVLIEGWPGLGDCSAANASNVLEWQVEDADCAVDGTLIPSFTGLRTADTVYIAYASGEHELYALSTDPYQLENGYLAADPALLSWLEDQRAALATCAGARCREIENRHR
jgi:N-acetylglucosamine-6-sulfatase